VWAKLPPAALRPQAPQPLTHRILAHDHDCRNLQLQAARGVDEDLGLWELGPGAGQEAEEEDDPWEIYSPWEPGYMYKHLFVDMCAEDPTLFWCGWPQGRYGDHLLTPGLPGMDSLGDFAASPTAYELAAEGEMVSLLDVKQDLLLDLRYWDPAAVASMLPIMVQQRLHWDADVEWAAARAVVNTAKFMDGAQLLAVLRAYDAAGWRPQERRCSNSRVTHERAWSALQLYTFRSMCSSNGCSLECFMEMWWLAARLNFQPSNRTLRRLLRVARRKLEEAQVTKSRTERRQLQGMLAGSRRAEASAHVLGQLMCWLEMQHNDD